MASESESGERGSAGRGARRDGREEEGEGNEASVSISARQQDDEGRVGRTLELADLAHDRVHLLEVHVVLVLGRDGVLCTFPPISALPFLRREMQTGGELD